MDNKMLIPQRVENSHHANILLAVCLDGAVYALEEGSGRVLWRSFGSFSEGPLLTRRLLRGSNSASGFDLMDYLVEPLGDGAIFQVNRSGEADGDEVKRLPFSLKSLVHLSPVHWRESDERALYLIAKRESRIFMLNLLTGIIERRQFTDDNEHVSDKELSFGNENVLLVGRTDYHLQGFDEAHLEAQWEIILTQFTSLHHESNKQSIEDESRNGEFYATFNGHLVSKQKNGPWIAKLSSPVLQVFRPVSAGSDDGRITLREVSIKGSSGAVAGSGSAEMQQRHVLFDQNRATFYFDDFVNIGGMALPSSDLFPKTGSNSSSSSSMMLLFALPQSHYPVVPSSSSGKMTIEDTGHERDASSIAAVKKQRDQMIKFMSVQRVTRQSVPPVVKLLDYASDDSSRGGVSLFLVLQTLLVLGSVMLGLKWWRRRREARRKGSTLEVGQEVLGYGSHGTVVFRGKFDGRPVAVKRLLSDFYSLADQEISLLQMHDVHPNVVRYFYREQEERFIFVALELADLSLQEFIEGKEEENGSIPTTANITTTTTTTTNITTTANHHRSSLDWTTKISILRQIMCGLEFLHSHNVIHRDLKPQNILLQVKNNKIGGSDNDVRVLISDFGLSRKLVETESSFHATAKAAGTLGWRAPEVIFNDESVKFSNSNKNSNNNMVVGPMKMNKSIDIFAAGLIFYFVLSEGQHAFGSRLVRESRISLYRPEIDSSLLGVEADNLVREMLKKDPRERPDANRVLGHPLFWSSEERLGFICAVSDILEGEERVIKREKVTMGGNDAPPGFEIPETPLPLRDAIDAVGPRIFKEEKTWHRGLERAVFQDLTKHRYYMVNKVHDLLRAIRNKRNHFHETPSAVQEIIGTDVWAMWRYFEEKFPCLLMETYHVMKKQKSKEQSLDKYL